MWRGLRWSRWLPVSLFFIAGVSASSGERAIYPKAEKVAFSLSAQGATIGKLFKPFNLQGLMKSD